MAPLKPRLSLQTHDVCNQPAPRGDIDLWNEDLPLREAVMGQGAIAYQDRLAELGATLGLADTREDGRLANRIVPQLQSFDRSGGRIDEVEYHPSYHALLRLGIAAGYPSVAWQDENGANPSHDGGHVAHAAMVYLMTQIEPGVCCPMTMTYAAIPALEADRDIAERWKPLLLSRKYDCASRPAWQKSGATLGMAMTEKQGGSDLRANTTRAVADGPDYRLTGHKWFCSAPMSDAFLTLAYAPGGLTCFLAPRWQPDGTRNAIHLMRLKDKLGNRANASAEIEYHGAFATRIGEEGDGVRTIIEMVHHTRLDTAMAPAGLMRAALSEVAWWCKSRSVFQRRLIDQPLMEAVLADLVLDWEAALALGMRVARSFDESAGDPAARLFSRLAVALAKYAANKRCPTVIYEAMECLGGSGFVEESPLPLLYREAPLNSIWEGSGNVICLDIMRTLSRQPEALERISAELEEARGADRRFDAASETALSRWPKGPDEREARWFAETFAILLQGALLIVDGPDYVADAFVLTRIENHGGRMPGALPPGLDHASIIARI